jgi:glutamine synthetase
LTGAVCAPNWGPGQIEFTFDPLPGLKSADNVLLLRGAIKQICRRHGYHATFMSRPALPNIVSSGWHLHQSLSSPDNANVFPGEGDALLSTTATHYLGGLLEHARAPSVLTTPTVKRLQAVHRPVLRAGSDRVGGGEPWRDDPSVRCPRRRNDPVRCQNLDVGL